MRSARRFGPTIENTTAELWDRGEGVLVSTDILEQLVIDMWEASDNAPSEATKVAWWRAAALVRDAYQRATGEVMRPDLVRAATRRLLR